MQRVAGEYGLSEPKTERSQRTLSLPQIAVKALRSHLIRQAEAGLRGPCVARNRPRDQGSGRRLPDGSTITHRFRARLIGAGLPAPRFHDLRHGAASLLLAQGANRRVVMEQLGHRQIGIMANLYIHVAPTMLQDAADRLNRALGG